MSIILGIGLATIFRAACTGRGCRIEKAPPLEEIEDKIFRYNDKCYKMSKAAVKCDDKKKIVPF
jgi:hypothetical protein